MNCEPYLFRHGCEFMNAKLGAGEAVTMPWLVAELKQRCGVRDDDAEAAAQAVFDAVERNAPAAIHAELKRRHLLSVEMLAGEHARRELAGKNLACWCKPGTPCHAETLLRVANAEGGGRKP